MEEELIDYGWITLRRWNYSKDYFTIEKVYKWDEYFQFYKRKKLLFTKSEAIERAKKLADKMQCEFRIAKYSRGGLEIKNKEK